MTSISLQPLYPLGCKTKQEDETTARHIYETSFPEDERRDFSQMKPLSEKAPFVFNLIKAEDDQVIGIISLWNFDTFTYIEHFAISDAIRGKGTGSKVLQLLKSKIQTPIIFEVELPQTQQARRRIEFYRRHDFDIQPYKYIQPPYDKTKQSLEMHIMTNLNTQPDKATFDHIVRTLYIYVYQLPTAKK